MHTSGVQLLLLYVCSHCKNLASINPWVQCTAGPGYFEVKILSPCSSKQLIWAPAFLPLMWVCVQKYTQFKTWEQESDWALTGFYINTPDSIRATWAEYLKFRSFNLKAWTQVKKIMSYKPSTSFMNKKKAIVAQQDTGFCLPYIVCIILHLFIHIFTYIWRHTTWIYLTFSSLWYFMPSHFPTLCHEMLPSDHSDSKKQLSSAIHYVLIKTNTTVSVSGWSVN